MKQYKLKTILAVISFTIGVFFISSCTDNFEDLNLHPTDPTEDDMTESERLGNLFSTLISTIHFEQENDNQHVEQMVGAQYGGYMVTTNNWQGTNFGTFNPSGDWVNTPFNTIMIDFNSNYAKIKKETGGKGPVYAWANILRVATMLRVADTYGPIPYSKIGEGGITVEYDSLEDAYHYMFNDLNSSIAFFTAYLADNPTGNPMGDFDPIYGGDFGKWLKFANSLKLRMAVRVALVDTEYAKKAIQEAIASGLIETNADNAILKVQKKNPYHLSANDWRDLAISATLSAYMNGYNDPRRPAYMTQASYQSAYRGVRMGIADINKDRYSNATYFSKPAFKADSPLLVYCAAETSFLKSEAILRGWIAGDDTMAKTYYEEGIRLSMEQHGLKSDEYTSYLTQTTSPESYRDIYTGISVSVSTPITVAWDNAGTNSNTKLEKIITQKWLANFPLGFESWCDHRRTGFPQFFPAVNNLSSSGFIGSVTNTSSRLVRRLPFPQSQYQGNGENVKKAVQMLGGDDTANTDLWWAKKQ